MFVCSLGTLEVPERLKLKMRRDYCVSESCQTWRHSSKTTGETKAAPEEFVQRTNDGIPRANHIADSFGKRNIVADMESGYLICSCRGGHKSRVRGCG